MLCDECLATASSSSVLDSEAQAHGQHQRREETRSPVQKALAEEPQALLKHTVDRAIFP